LTKRNLNVITLGAYSGKNKYTLGLIRMRHCCKNATVPFLFLSKAKRLYMY